MEEVILLGICMFTRSFSISLFVCPAAGLGAARLLYWPRECMMQQLPWLDWSGAKCYCSFPSSGAWWSYWQCYRDIHKEQFAQPCLCAMSWGLSTDKEFQSQGMILHSVFCNYYRATSYHECSCLLFMFTKANFWHNRYICDNWWMSYHYYLCQRFSLYFRCSGWGCFFAYYGSQTRRKCWGVSINYYLICVVVLLCKTGSRIPFMM